LSPRALQGTHEGLHVRTTNDPVAPPLGPNIDHVKAKPILVDHTIQALIAGAPEPLGRVEVYGPSGWRWWADQTSYLILGVPVLLAVVGGMLARWARRR